MTRIDANSAKMFFDIIEKLYNQKGEFFYNEFTSFADGVFRQIRGLRKTAKHYIKTVQPDVRDFKKATLKAIRLLDTILAYKYLYEDNIKSLTKMKEQLESLYVMVELSI